MFAAVSRHVQANDVTSISKDEERASQALLHTGMVSYAFNFQPSYNWWAGHGGKLDQAAQAAQACAFEQASESRYAKVRGQIGQIDVSRSSLFCLAWPRSQTRRHLSSHSCAIIFEVARSLLCYLIIV